MIGIADNMFNSPVTVATKAAVQAKRKSKELKERYMKIAAGDASQKRFCPILLPNGISTTGRRVNEDMKPTGNLFIDYDEKGNGWQILWDKVKDHLQEWNILLVEKSARGGAHMVVKRKSGLTIEEDIDAWEDRLGLKLDHVHDLARCMYIVPDDYVLYEDDELYETIAYPRPKNEPTPNPSLKGRELKSLPLGGDLEEAYLGLPYDEIITEWWRQHNGGKTPVVSNRDTLTFELAVNLRHICGFDRSLMDRVIPNYDGFPEEEKLKCIDSALKEKRSRMPARLQSVLSALKSRHACNKEILQAIDEAEEEDEHFYVDRLNLDALPKSIIASFDSLKKSLWMPAILGVAPMAGALATGVRMAVHNRLSHLNLISYIIGESGSGKSFMDELFTIWMAPIIASDRVYHEQEQEYLEKLDRKKNSNLRPEKPKLPIRIQSLRTSLSQIVKRLRNACGMHLFSYTPEADQMSQNNKASWSNLTVLFRCLFDGSKFDTDYANGDSTGLYVEHVLWNMVLCGTPDALYRAITNYTNGEANRLALAKVPDNTFAALGDTPLRSSEAENLIGKTSQLLMMLHGDLNLEGVEAKGREWLEKIRLEALKDYNTTFAGLRMRAVITASRIICTHILQAYVEYLMDSLDNHKGKLPKWAHGCSTAAEYLRMHPKAIEEEVKRFQTEGMMNNLDVIADYIIDQLYYYFGEKIDMAKNSIGFVGYQKRFVGKNDAVFNRLSEEFTLNDARVAKGSGTSGNAARQMCKNWKAQGLIESITPGHFRKLIKGV